MGAPRSLGNMILMGDCWKRSTMRVPCAEPARTRRADPSDRCRSWSLGTVTLEAPTVKYPQRSTDERSSGTCGRLGPQRRIPVHVDPFGSLRRHVTAATVRLVIG